MSNPPEQSVDHSQPESCLIDDRARLETLVHKGQLCNCWLVAGVSGVPHADVAGWRGDVPVSRFNHAAVCVNDAVYICGGQDKNFNSLSDVWYYDSTSKETKTLKKLQPLPEERSGHSVVYSNSALWVFGGAGDGVALGTTAKYDLDSGLWESLDLAKAPPARFAHGATVLDDVMTIFGGNSGKIDYFGDMWSLNISTLTWTEHKFKRDSKGPGPIAGMVVTRTETDMLLHGGLKREKLEASDELWKYDFRNNIWNKLEVAGCAPGPLVGHNGVKVGNSWFLFSGRVGQIEDDTDFSTFHMWELGIEPMIWRKVSVIDSAPTPWGFPTRRYGAAAVYVPSQERILLMGGYTHTDGKGICPTTSFAYINLLGSIKTIDGVSQRIRAIDVAAAALDSGRQILEENLVGSLADQLLTTENKENLHGRIMDPELENAVAKMEVDVPFWQNKYSDIGNLVDDIAKQQGREQNAVDKVNKRADSVDKLTDKLKDRIYELQGLTDVLKAAAKPAEEPVVEDRDLVMKKAEEEWEPPAKSPIEEAAERLAEIKPKIRSEGEKLRVIEKGLKNTALLTEKLNRDKDAVIQVRNKIADVSAEIEELSDRAADLKAGTRTMIRNNPGLMDLVELMRRINQIHAALNVLNGRDNDALQEGGQIFMSVQDADRPQFPPYGA